MSLPYDKILETIHKAFGEFEGAMTNLEVERHLVELQIAKHSVSVYNGYIEVIESKLRDAGIEYNLTNAGMSWKRKSATPEVNE